MKSLLSPLVIAIFLLARAYARELTQGRSFMPRTLVLTDKSGDDKKFSLFINDLKESGHDLTVESSDGVSPLKSFGEWEYDNIVYLASQASTVDGIKRSTVAEFLGDGGSLVLACGENAGDFCKYLSRDLGVDLSPKNARTLDHFAGEQTGDVTVIKSTRWHHNPLLTGKLAQSKSANPVWWKGTSLSVHADNFLAFTLLQGLPTTYTVSSKGKNLAAGSDTKLVVAIQAQNNARVVVSGSLDMFTDKMYGEAKSSNADFIRATSDWVFGKTGVLRATNITHHRADGRSAEPMLKTTPTEDLPFSLYPDPEIARDSLVYRIKDNLTYSLTIEELKSGKWQPYQADDVQLEFVMLDPYVRTTMDHDGKGRFFTTFTAPDTYGIFHFRTHYRREGYSTIHLTDKVSLRPYKHDEYDRFIFSAYPYYASVFSSMLCFFVFCVAFLYGNKA